MSDSIFCCSSITPFRPRSLDHEAKFTAFMRWARVQKPSTPRNDGSTSIIDSAPYAIQLVRQINYGPQESIRYFVLSRDDANFTEAKEDDLIKSNFEKLNSYKNFRCDVHNRFFEVNLYQKSPTNTHHWRSNLARPSRDIDLALRQQKEEAEAESTEDPGVKGEKGREVASIDTKTKTASEDPVPTLEKAPGTAPREPEPSRRPDNETLKRTLRFLLPAASQKLGTNRLVSLLCLDRANAELNLGLEFESLWESELTVSNILFFFIGCFAVCESSNTTVELADVEKLVVPAMRYVDSRKAQLPTGRARPHEIVKMVLEPGGAPDWVSVYREGVLSVFASGPSEALLEHCRPNDDAVQESRNNVDGAGSCEGESEKDERELWWHGDGPEDIDYGYYERYDSDGDAMKDYTACDKECGYCGNCDY